MRKSLQDILCTHIMDGISCKNIATAFYSKQISPFYFAYCKHCHKMAFPHGESASSYEQEITREESLIRQIMNK